MGGGGFAECLIGLRVATCPAWVSRVNSLIKKVRTGVHDLSGNGSADLGQCLPHRGHHPRDRVGRRGQCLDVVQPAAGVLRQHQIGEGAADIDADIDAHDRRNVSVAAASTAPAVSMATP